MHFTLSDLVSDIAQNGAESGADLLELAVQETLDSSGKGEFRFTVKDNGKGMSPQELERAQDPFVSDGIKHPHRRVGLGLPFLIQTAEVSGGGWKVESGSAGTTLCAWFDLGNVDTPPVGDIPGMFRTVLLFEGPSEVIIQRVRGGDEYEVRKSELVEALGGLEDSQSLILLTKYLESLEESGDE